MWLFLQKESQIGKKYKKRIGDVPSTQKTKKIEVLKTNGP